MMDSAGPVHITMKMEPVIVKSIMNINMRLVVFGNTVHTERRKLIMEEKNIEKIVIHYDNGEENTIHKGFMCDIKEDTESGEATLDFTMCHISGRDLEMIVMGCLELGERLGMFDGRKEKPE